MKCVWQKPITEISMTEIDYVSQPFFNILYTTTLIGTRSKRVIQILCKNHWDMLTLNLNNEPL